ncbi:DNRLRE domain-containing protein [Streptomyces longispororuber]|uniref:DNRLRE domain-containing protein n=1 Tax=Streptomyces longispororuber TaxID=68230 RepID=UPI0036FBC3EE
MKRNSRISAGRRGRRLALATALVVVAEAGLLSVAGTAVSAPADPETGSTRPTKVSKKDVLESDLKWAASHAKGSKAWAVVEARKTGKKVVVDDETTATTYTVANPDGTLTTELTSGPERVWRDGRWRKADATLKAAADGAVTARNHPGGLRLAGESGTTPRSLRAAAAAPARDLVTLGEGKKQITLQWKGGLPAPVLDGTRATYEDALPDADVIVEATRSGFEQFVEIKKRPAGAYTYTLPVKTRNLQAKANKDGSISFTDPATGTEEAVMPAPVMWDASVHKGSGLHTNRAPVDVEVVNRGGGDVDLVMTPDAAWLADPKTRFPVTVDPATSALSNLGDTYVQQGETKSFWSDVELDLGNPGTKNGDGTPRTARSYIKWNTEPVKDALVEKATLSLWNFHSGNTDCKPKGWTVWDTDDPSGSVTWANQDTVGKWRQQFTHASETKGNSGCAGQGDGWINADVTKLVQTWASAKSSTGTSGLRAYSDNVQDWKRVNSANATKDQPKLTVTYNYRPASADKRQAGSPFKSYAGVWAVNTTTPTLRDTFDDANNDKVNATFEIYDAATNKPVDLGTEFDVLVSKDVPAGKLAEVKVPAGKLKDGRTYKFRTSAYDGTHHSEDWSAWTSFVVDTTAPGEPKSVTSATYPENWGGGGAGVAGLFHVDTGVADARDVQFRLDPFVDDAEGANWNTAATGASKAPAPRGVAAPPVGNTASYSVTPAADGNHVVQTRTVDRADNVGPIKDYGFTAGNRDYNRKPKIDIKLPANDSSSQQPEPSDPPQPAWKNWKNGGGPTVRTFRTGAHTEVTVTPKDRASKEFTRKAAKQRATRAASYPDPVVKDAWCQPSLFGAAQKSLMTRTEACVFLDLQFVAESKLQDGVVPVKYRANFEVHFQVKTDSRGDAIKTWVQINPVFNNFPGNERAVVMGAGNPGAWFDSMCVSDGCNTGGDSARQKFDFFGDLTWKGGMNGNTPVDTHMATGTADHKWNGNVNNASGTTDNDLSKTMAVFFSGRPATEVEPPPGLNGKKGEWRDDYGQWESPKLLVTCDKVGSYGPAGCVLPQYAPTYQFNTAAYPEAAAHAWLIQNKSKVKGLGQSWDKPLQYLPPKARNKQGYDPQKSRDAMCTRYQGSKSAGTGWVPRKTFLPHPKTVLHHVGPHFDEVNCDEFPFASTYQSAGMKKADGGQNEAPGAGAACMQTVSATADDGSVHFMDDTRYDAPSFTENCGRSSMSGDVNQGSMRPFGEFAKQMRLLDEEAYFLDPGNAWFKECDTTKAELVCTMKKP